MAERLERLLNLLIALRERARPMTAEEVRTTVAGYGQSDQAAFRRMFSRDKADLRALGVPIETVAADRFGDAIGYRIRGRHADLPPLRLAPEELGALAVAVQVTGLGDLAQGGLRKLEVSADAPGASRGAQPPPVALRLDRERLPTLLAAQLRREPVAFAYGTPTGAAAERTVDPHGLVHRRGRWYLVGRDHDRDAVRAFRLDRIEGQARPVGEPGAFTPPEDPPDTSAVVPDPPDPVAARLAVRGPHRGGLDAVAVDAEWSLLTLADEDPHELLAWALSAAPDVVILEPRWLAQRARDRLAALSDPAESHGS